VYSGSAIRRMAAAWLNGGAVAVPVRFLSESKMAGEMEKR
jgi:hypothetical protein